MVQLIVGHKGSGKTKAMVEMANRAVKESKGNVVVVEKDVRLTYEISSQARLVYSDEYAISGYDAVYGFITGLLAGNYDITRVFIDGLYKIIGGKDAAKAEEFLVALDAFSSKHSVNFTVSLSEEPESATEGMKRFL